MTFCMCVGLYNQNQLSVEYSDCRNPLSHFVLSFVRPSYFKAFIVTWIVLGAASLMSNL